MASKAVEGSDRDAELATPRPANANRLGTGMSPGPTPRFTGDDSPLVSRRIDDLTDDEEEEEAGSDEGASSASSVVTLCNSAIGAGVLSLPYAFRCAGIAGCVIMCFVLAGAQAVTLYTLSKFAERYDADTYSVLTRKTVGRKLSAALSASLVIYQLGSCSAYLIIIGDTISPLLQHGFGEDAFFAGRQFVIIFFAIFIIMPLCFPRNLSSLHYVSTAGVLGFLYTAAAIMIEGTKIVRARGSPWEDVHWFNWDFKALFAIPIIVFGFNCHANVVTVFDELGDEPDVLVTSMPRDPRQYRRHSSTVLAPKPRTLKMIGMISVIISSVSIIMVGYLAVGFAGYLTYPNDIDSNVLKSFPYSPILLKIARGAIAGVVTGHYPLNNNAARVGLEHLELYYFGWKDPSVNFARMQTVLFVLATLAIGLTVTDLGTVLHLIGGTVAAFIIFFLPGLMLVNAAIIKGDAPSGPSTSNSLHDLQDTLLAEEGEVGIKRTGLIYSPRWSWWFGVTFVTLSVFIFVITIATAFIDAEA